MAVSPVDAAKLMVCVVAEAGVGISAARQVELASAFETIVCFPNVVVTVVPSGAKPHTIADTGAR